ncbi:MAG: fibronectin type III domain-containing protein, partial [Actinomycetota bacterium]
MGRRVTGAVVAASLMAAALAGAAVPASADTGNPLDFGPVFARAGPAGYPAKFVGYYTRPDATKWGWNEQVLPVGLADGRGQNSASAAIAMNCFPATGEEPKDQLLALNRALLEGACKLHPGAVTFNFGTAHRGRTRDGNTFSTQDRRYFIRYSRTSDCESPTVNGDGTEVAPDMTGYGLRMDVIRGIADANTQITRQIPVDKVGQYLCIAQGHTGSQFVESRIPIVGVDEAFFWRVRGPWTVFKIVAAGDSDKPTGVTATAGNAEALVRWDYTASQLAATTFTATSSPDGRTCWVLGAKTCLVTGLRNDVAYKFTVRAERGALRADSAPSDAVTPRDASAPGPGGNAANVQPLAASRLIVAPVNSNDVRPLGAVEVTAPLSGSLSAGQQITGRFVLACFVADRGDGCGAERRQLELRATIEL